MKFPAKISKGLSEEQLTFLQQFFAKSPEQLSSCVMLRSYPQNHTLINTDDSCTCVYILLKGRLQAVEERVATEPYRFTEIQAVNIVGDFELFTSLPGRVITLTTLERSLCLIIPAADYLNWIKNDANALFIRTQMVISQLTAQTQFERQNRFLDNRTRMLRFLCGECHRQAEPAFPLLIRSTRQDIACKLGCSVRTVNRTVTSLQEEGILSLEHGKIKLTDNQFQLIQKRLDTTFFDTGY